HSDAETGSVPERARPVHELPSAGDLGDRMAEQQPLEMLDESDDRLIGELAEGQLAKPVDARFRRYPNQRQIERFDPAADETVLELLGELVTQEKCLDG